MRFALSAISLIAALSSTAQAQDTTNQDLCRYVRDGYCSLGLIYHPGVTDSLGAVYIFGQHCNSIIQANGAVQDCNGNLCKQYLKPGQEGRYSLADHKYQLVISDFEVAPRPGFHFAYAGFSVDSSKGCDCQDISGFRDDGGKSCRCEFQCDQP